jgi:hypothetical protein
LEVAAQELDVFVCGLV